MHRRAAPRKPTQPGYVDPLIHLPDLAGRLSPMKKQNDLKKPFCSGYRMGAADQSGLMEGTI